MTSRWSVQGQHIGVKVVHLHAAKAVAPSVGPCANVCGVPCGTRETTAYAILDPERVTCRVCLLDPRLKVSS